MVLVFFTKSQSMMNMNLVFKECNDLFNRAIMLLLVNQTMGTPYIIPLVKRALSTVSKYHSF